MLSQGLLLYEVCRLAPPSTTAFIMMECANMVRLARHSASPASIHRYTHPHARIELAISTRPPIVIPRHGHRSSNPSRACWLFISRVGHRASSIAEPCNRAKTAWESVDTVPELSLLARTLSIRDTFAGGPAELRLPGVNHGSTGLCFWRINMRLSVTVQTQCL